MRQAFLSVSQKPGIETLARKLLGYNIQLLASDGTADYLKKLNIPVKSVTESLKLQPLLDGRVKTLHPTIYGAILCDRNKPSHLDDLTHLKTDAIDFIIVDLYPFEQYHFDPLLLLKILILVEFL